MDESYHEEVRKHGSWIDKEFLEEVLMNSLQQEVTVQDIRIRAAVPMGENYMGLLYRTKVKYTVPDTEEEGEINLMIKGTPLSEQMAIQIEAMGVFDKENYYYVETLPKMKSLIDKYFPEGTRFVAPEGYRTKRPNTLIMEDIGQDGYRNLKRSEQLNFEQCEATLKTLARMHALSIKLHTLEPETVRTPSTQLYFPQNEATMHPLTTGAVETLANAMANWPDEDGTLEVIIGKMRRIVPMIWRKCMAIELPSEHVNVLNHGDLWMNNIMFKLDENDTLHSVKLVDFQIMRFCSPALDLTYFLCTSIRPEVISGHFLQLIDIYHAFLMADLSTLQIEVDYPLEQLHKEMRDRVPFALTTIAFTLAVVLAPSDGVGDLLPQEDEENSVKLVYATELYRTAATALLSTMEEIGYLDDGLSRLNHVLDHKPIERVQSAHDRHIVARLKSAVRGTFRKMFDF